MSIRSPRTDPEAQHPSPYRGCKWTLSKFVGGPEIMMVHSSTGELIGKFAVPQRLATPEFEQMMQDWLERDADPLPAADRAAHLRLA